MYDEIKAQVWEYYRHLRQIVADYPVYEIREQLKWVRAEVEMWKGLSGGK